VLECLVYISVASNRLDLTGQAALIAEEAESYNLEHGISGALAVHEGHFVHTLEGDPTALDQLLKRLEDDPRHHDLVLVDRWPIEQRLFAGWFVAGVAMDKAIRAEVEALIANPTLSPRGLAASMRSRAIPLRRAFSAAAE